MLQNILNSQPDYILVLAESIANNKDETAIDKTQS